MVLRVRRWVSVVSVLALGAGAWLVALTVPAGAVTVSTEAELQTAFGTDTEILLANDIDLTCVGGGDLDRNSATALTLDGNGFTIRQTCAGQRVMQQAGTGALAVENVTLTGGSAVGPGVAGFGGAIYSNGSLTITGATVTGNTATDGSAGMFADGSVTVTDSTISGNTTAGGGGGISSVSDITVTDSTVSDNHATGSSGGGIDAFGSVTVTGSTISGNTAAGDAGGILAEGSVTVTDSTISGNTATRGGGGMTAASGSVTVTNSTISGNTAGAFGGGGIRAFGNVTLVYATVVGNTALDLAANVRSITGVLSAFGSVVALPQGGAANCLAESTTSNGFNFSDDDSCGFTNVAQGDRENAGDPLLGSLADNGGPTQTRLPQTGSPLIDAIPIVSCQADGASGITTDQRGVTRPQLDGCDIGAVEVEPPPPPAPPPSDGEAAPVLTPRFTG